MSKIIELLRAEGLKLNGGKQTGPRSKVLAQADKMLSKLSEMKSPKEMNSTSSNQNWWANQSKGNMRNVTIKYDGRVVEYASEWVEDTLEAVIDVIKAIRRAIEKTNDSDWSGEEERRAKMKRQSKG